MDAMLIAQRIAEAETALHAIYLGQHAVKVTIEGQETEFNRASAPQLEAYLMRLRLQLETGGVASRGAIGMIF